jgi:hypothetical protein
MSSLGKPTRTRTAIIGPGSVLRLPSAKIAAVILAVVIFLAVFGSMLAPQNPLTINANALYRACTTCSARITSAGTCSAG